MSKSCGSRRGARIWLSACVALAVVSCGGSAITSQRVETAVERTFANLVEVQVSRLKLQPAKASELDVTASCRRLADGVDAGSGEWLCRVRWLGADRQPMLDAFDLSVTAEGCYTATAEGQELGGVTLKANDGRDVKNLLHAFEGCFDTM